MTSSLDMALSVAVDLGLPVFPCKLKRSMKKVQFQNDHTLGMGLRTLAEKRRKFVSGGGSIPMP